MPSPFLPDDVERAWTRLGGLVGRDLQALELFCLERLSLDQCAHHFRIPRERFEVMLLHAASAYAHGPLLPPAPFEEEARDARALADAFTREGAAPPRIEGALRALRTLHALGPALHDKARRVDEESEASGHHRRLQYLRWLAAAGALVIFWLTRR
jgi:hypothetical protein